MLCPEMVGRGPVLGELVERIAGRSADRGGVIVLVGEAGIGKSRLLAGAVENAGVIAFTGRAVPVESPVPYRPLTEAILAAMRGRTVPTDDTLAGFEGQLARLVPHWPAVAPTDESPLLLGESVARLFAVLDSERRSMLVLEDLHWADIETLAVVEYLCDALPDVGGWCVVTTRDAEATASDRRTTRAAPWLRCRARSRRSTRPACRAWSPPAWRRRTLRPAWSSSCTAIRTGIRSSIEELLAGLIAAGVLAQRRRALGDRRHVDRRRPGESARLGRPTSRRPRARAATGDRGGRHARSIVHLGVAAGHRRSRRSHDGGGACRRPSTPS